LTPEVWAFYAQEKLDSAHYSPFHGEKRVYRVLILSKSFGRGAKRESLAPLFEKYDLHPTFLSMEAVRGSLSEFDGLVIGTDRIEREFFERALRVRVIVKYGVGTDNIDLGTARDRGVRVLNLPGINSTTVAEMALGLMLAAARRIAEGDRGVRSGRWEGLVGTEVAGKTLGIVGTGSVGCALSQLVAGLRMRLLGFDRLENPEFLAAGGRYVPLTALLSSSDFVSLHVPLTAETFHLLDAERLGLMKPGSFLINTSRGKVIDEMALCEALAGGRLAGAALDVFESEPPANDRLLSLESAVFTPHASAYTDETLRRMDDACLRLLSEELRRTDFRGSDT